MQISEIEQRKYPYRFFNFEDKLFLYDMYTNKILELQEISPCDINTVEDMELIYKNIFGEEIYDIINVNKLNADSYYNRLVQRYKTDNYETRELLVKITMNCNLQCSYCPQAKVFGNERNSEGIKGITTENLESSLKWLFSKKSKSYKILFYGGEPLLLKDRIYSTIEMVNKYYSQYVTEYYLITNGTIIDEILIDFFIENNIVVCISVDGNQIEHDKKRKFMNSDEGSYGSIARSLELFQKKNPSFYRGNVVFYCTYDADKGIDYYRKLFSTSPMFVGNQVLYNRLRDFEQECGPINVPLIAKTRPNQPQNNPVNFRKMLSVLIDKTSNPYDRRMLEDDPNIVIGGMCKVGTEKLYVDPHGKIEICDKITCAPIVGELCSFIHEEKLKELLTEYYNWLKDHCENCFASRVCVSCFATFYNHLYGKCLPNLSSCHEIISTFEHAISVYISSTSKKKEENDEQRNDYAIRH